MSVTRKEKVLKVLEANSGTWIDGHVLCHPEIGGSEGLRRLRELRADGHIIEMRKKPGAATRQYRIVLADKTKYGMQLKMEVR